MSNIKVEAAMGVEEELGTSDEIKEFRHEGELESHKDALLDIKNSLAMSADKPPLAAALDVSINVLYKRIVYTIRYTQVSSTFK